MNASPTLALAVPRDTRTEAAVSASTTGIASSRVSRNDRSPGATRCESPTSPRMGKSSQRASASISTFASADAGKARSREPTSQTALAPANSAHAFRTRSASSRTAAARHAENATIPATTQAPFTSCSPASWLARRASALRMRQAITPKTNRATASRRIPLQRSASLTRN